MARQHDLTALLPFPTRIESAPTGSQRRAQPSGSERGRGTRRTATTMPDGGPISRSVDPAVSSPSAEVPAADPSAAEVLQLDQLELTELVRQRANRGTSQRQVATPDRTTLQGPAERRVRRSVWEGRATAESFNESSEITGSFGFGFFGTGFASPRRALVRTRKDAGRSGTTVRDEATRSSSSTDGAVPSPGFVLDLVGAVAVMALVLLAAILI